MTSSALEAALLAVEAGDLNGAIVQLLEAWRATRAPRIAEQLDAVTLELAPSAIEIEGDGETAQRAWLEVALADRPEDLPALLETLVVGRADDDPHEPSLAAIQSAERVWALEPREDPRLARALVALLDQPPFLAARNSRNGIDEFWEEFKKALLAIGDVRAARPLQTFAGRVRSLTTEVDAWAEDNCYTHGSIGPYLEHWLGIAAKELRATSPAPLSAEEVAICARLESLLPRRSR